MSCTEIYALKNSKTYCIGEVRNSFRGAMAIWKSMEKKYLPKYIPDWAKSLNRTDAEYSRTTTSMSSDEEPINEIWSLFKNDNVSKEHKIVLGSTFDNVLVKTENIGILLDAFRSYDAETSLKEQAELIEKAIKDDPDIIAIGWNQTSVNCDVWTCCKWDGTNDEDGEKNYRDYLINKDEDHWFLLEAIDKKE